MTNGEIRGSFILGGACAQSRRQSSPGNVTERDEVFTWSLGGRDLLQPPRAKPPLYQMTIFKSEREKERERQTDRERRTEREQNRETEKKRESIINPLHVVSLPTGISRLIRSPESASQRERRKESKAGGRGRHMRWMHLTP